MRGKFWDKQAGKYDDLVRKHDGTYDKTIASARSLLSASDIVLDLGCASGEYSLDIASFVRSVHGIDTSAGMIALAARKVDDRRVGNVTFDAAGIFDRSLDARRFTAVLAFCVLHLVGDLHPVLRRIGELLPAGGLLVSETPCLRESGLLFSLFFGAARMARIVPPVLRLVASELEAEIAGAGFDIAESERWDRKKAVHWIVARKR